MKKGFKLVTECTFQAPAREVWDVTVDVIAYPEWWPYIQMLPSVGMSPVCSKTHGLITRLRASCLTHFGFILMSRGANLFSRIEMMASGDLVGTGISILDESNGVTRATFIWNLALTPPILDRLSQWKLFHNLFVWNHDFTMRSAVKNMQERVHYANA